VGPLSHLTLLDLTHMVSGPYGTMLLADLGMQTIKVEPLTGEGTRRLLASDARYARGGVGAYFLTLNRNKKSVAIDLKSEEGLGIFYDLVRRADVVFDNFGPGATKRLKIDYDSLALINQRIITCSVSGFGGDGPGARRPAFDLVAQGMGGGMSITGRPGEGPLRSGIPIGDLGGGAFGALGVLAAIIQREQTGRGQQVDISMLDCQVSLLNYMATMYLMSGRAPSAEGNGHFVHVPYNVFPTKTRYIIIAIVQDDSWLALVDAMKLPELRNAAFRTQPGRLAARLQIEAALTAALATREVEHWLDLFSARKIPCAPVNGIADAVADEQVLHRHMIVDVPVEDGPPIRMPGNPIKMSGNADPPPYAAPPGLGAHTSSVLGGVLGMDREKVADLVARRVVR
jgi:crotonobetainyl-CoA:carnitine CoA-transferase CaiB-like acyl-CoA transferase